MPISKKFTTATTLSKTIAMVLFLLLPFAGFYLGIQYQRDISPQTPDQPTIVESLFCTRWQTVCDPKYTDPNGGCAPKKICADHALAPTQAVTISESPSPQTKPSCRPRPACLDATPRCLIPEMPDMCPRANSAVTPRVSTQAPDQTYCTQDAKQCPDGSYVGRSGPHCDFTACPDRFR